MGTKSTGTEGGQTRPSEGLASRLCRLTAICIILALGVFVLFGCTAVDRAWLPPEAHNSQPQKPPTWTHVTSERTLVNDPVRHAEKRDERLRWCLAANLKNCI